MSVPTRIIKRGMFGKPTLQWLKNNGAASSGTAAWVKEWTRYGEWTAKLTPGAQSGDDYGAVEFVVNNMPLTDLKSIRYIYRMGSTEVIAPNVAIHVYDPNDIDNRADITLSHSHDDLGKTTSTWYKFDLLPATDGLFYYGNNIPTTTGLVAHGTAGNLYTLTEYQEDAVFSTYVISKITIEYGYYSTGTIGAAHIAKIQVNEEDIILEPSVETIQKTIQPELNIIAAVAADAQDKSDELALTNVRKASVFIDHGRDATTAFVGAGTEYKIEVSEKASGNDTWRTIASAVCGITTALGHAMDAEEAAGTTVIEIGATTPLVNDIQFFKNATIANSEWGKVVALVASTSLTLQDGLTNTQAAITTYSQGEHFVFLLDVAAYTRLRVICNNNNGTTNQAIVWRCACITEA